MEKRTIRLNLDVSFVYGPRTWRVPLAAMLLLCAVGDLNSESVTLSTYYPAPSGVYTQMITTGDTYLARDGAGTRVGIGTTTPTQKLSVVGNVDVSAGYVKISSVGCGVADVTQGVVCSGTQYATFTPGFYIEGWSYQNRGGAVIAEAGPGQTTTQVRALNPTTGSEDWMTLKKNDSSTRIWCCPR
ncbi:MAG: hypothetical protein HYV14_02375 [Elusimicrobia bacterium]|nr:hypothetical protein [Elusimicrobiota bacterium]